jgi:Icc-related predicted phosphoesterase
MKLSIVAISDTHNRHNNLIIPHCDILIHAGDESGMGYEHEIRNFAKWFSKQPATHLIWTPGNHSVYFEDNYPLSLTWFKEECPNGVVLINSGVQIEGINIYGSPITPTFYKWAYMADRGESIKKYWDMIPIDTNILITHGPPYGILDELVYVDGTPKGIFVGCQDLSNRIKDLKDLDLHFFGHIHAQANQERHINGTSYYNVAICDESYYPSNPPREVDYEFKSR